MKKTGLIFAALLLLGAGGVAEVRRGAGDVVDVALEVPVLCKKLCFLYK